MHTQSIKCKKDSKNKSYNKSYNH